jgi:hypothetical protein
VSFYVFIPTGWYVLQAYSKICSDIIHVSNYIAPCTQRQEFDIPVAHGYLGFKKNIDRFCGTGVLGWSPSVADGSWIPIFATAPPKMNTLKIDRYRVLERERNLAPYSSDAPRVSSDWLGANRRPWLRSGLSGVGVGVDKPSTTLLTDTRDIKSNLASQQSFPRPPRYFWQRTNSASTHPFFDPPCVAEQNPPRRASSLFSRPCLRLSILMSPFTSTPPILFFVLRSYLTISRSVQLELQLYSPKLKLKGDNRGPVAAFSLDDKVSGKVLLDGSCHHTGRLSVTVSWLVSLPLCSLVYSRPAGGNFLLWKTSRRGQDIYTLPPFLQTCFPHINDVYQCMSSERRVGAFFPEHIFEKKTECVLFMSTQWSRVPEACISIFVRISPQL